MRENSSPEQNSSMDLQGGAKFIIRFLSICLVFFHLYTGGVGPFPNIQQRAIHAGLAMMICFCLQGF